MSRNMHLGQYIAAHCFVPVVLLMPSMQAQHSMYNMLRLQLTSCLPCSSLEIGAIWGIRQLLRPQEVQDVCDTQAQ